MLKSRWLTLMKYLGFSENIDTLKLLLDAYSGNGRHYHNVKHLEAVLKCIDNTAFLAENKYEIEIALWFHDSIYTLFSKSNELDSAKWASRFLKKNSACMEVQQHVNALILATAHLSPPKTNDEKLIVDIDLLVLGLNESHYDKFLKEVRSEYRIVPTVIYRRKRKEVLSRFLKREKIYFLDYFFEKYESVARENIKREIKSL